MDGRRVDERDEDDDDDILIEEIGPDDPLIEAFARQFTGSSIKRSEKDEGDDNVTLNTRSVTGRVVPPPPPHRTSDSDEDDDLIIEEMAPGVAPSLSANDKDVPSLAPSVDIIDEDDDLIIEEVTGETAPDPPAPLDDEDDDLIIEEATAAVPNADNDEFDDLIIEEVTPECLAGADGEDDDLIIEEVTASASVNPPVQTVDDEDDDLIIEEVTAPPSVNQVPTPDDEDDDDLIIEEVTAPPSLNPQVPTADDEDDDDLIIEEVPASTQPCLGNDTDDEEIRIEEVTNAPTAAPEPNADKDDEDDDLIIEEVTAAAPPADDGRGEDLRIAGTSAVPQVLLPPDVDEEDDDLIIEEVTGVAAPSPSPGDCDEDVIVEEITAASPTKTPVPATDPAARCPHPVADDEDLIIQDVTNATPATAPMRAADDEEDDDVIIEEVTTVSAEDEEEYDTIVLEKTRISKAGDETVKMTSAVGENVGLEETALQLADDEDDDEDDVELFSKEEDDDDMVIIEEVDAPELTGREGLRSGFLVAKNKAPPSAEELRRLKEAKRAQGNEQFAKKQYKVAKDYYTQAIEIDPYDFKSYSNRSACHFELGDFGAAQEDGVECVRLAPGFVKGHFRLARAARCCGDFKQATDACMEGLEVVKYRGANARALHEELRIVKRIERRERRRSRIQGELRELCAEMTPEERRWKAWWGGQGHPTLINNSNLDRYVPDARIDVSYDPQVSQELHGPDNLPRLEEDDDDDEDDLLLEDVLRRLDVEPDDVMAAFEDAGMGPRSFLTCARLLPLVLARWLEANARQLSLDTVVALADAQARDCLEESWDDGAEALFPTSPELAFSYPLFSWRQRVNDVELRLLLPAGCSAKDLVVTLQPRRIRVIIKRSGLRFWPYVKNAWSRIADVGPQLPAAFDNEEDEPIEIDEDDLDPIELIPNQPASAMQAFREAQAGMAARTLAATAESDDDEEQPIVEEMEEESSPPTCVEVRWMEDSVILRSIQVPECASVDELMSIIERKLNLPKHLQLLSTPEGAQLGDKLVPVVLVAEKPPPPPDEVVLLDHELSRKILVDDSLWHISKPHSTQGHALQGPILVFQLAKFQSLQRGTAKHAGQLYWKRVFLHTTFEDVNVRTNPPTDFYGCK